MCYERLTVNGRMPALTVGILRDIRGTSNTALTPIIGLVELGAVPIRYRARDTVGSSFFLGTSFLEAIIVAPSLLASVSD